MPSAGTSAGGAGASSGDSAGRASGASAGASSGASAGGASALGGASGASAGGGGLAGGARECLTDADCKIFDDCCSCSAVPATETPASCHRTCLQSACSALGTPTPKATCVVGQCVAGFSCDSTQVLCKSVPPQCPAGELPIVSGACWQGGCVAAEQCASVADCSACTGSLASMTCVLERSDSTGHCVSIPAGCYGQCSCLESRVCVKPGEKCTDLSGIHGVTCGP
jgi:hypothetical protein